MNPLLLDFPDSFDTERLTIRAPRVEDAQEVIDAVTESLPELRPWMPWANETSTSVAFQRERLRAPIMGRGH